MFFYRESMMPFEPSIRARATNIDIILGMAQSANSRRAIALHLQYLFCLKVA